MAEATGDQGLGVDVRMGMSRYDRLAGNAAAARDWANDALSLARRTGYHHEQGQALIERGRALWALGDCAAAEADWREVPPGSWLDWEAFEEHVRRGEWAAAVALYGGELCPEDCYADWAIMPRERLARQFVVALLALAGEQLAAGSPQEAPASARRALEVDPWQESAVLVGMQACLALNDRAGALRLYRDLERTLRQELGIAPQGELQTLYRSLCQA